MVGHNSNDWLPAGWTIHDKHLKNGHVVRSYNNLKTGKTFHTKNEVIHYSKRESYQPGGYQEVDITSGEHPEESSQPGTYEAVDVISNFAHGKKPEESSQPGTCQAVDEVLRKQPEESNQLAVCPTEHRKSKMPEESIEPATYEADNATSETLPVDQSGACQVVDRTWELPEEATAELASKSIEHPKWLPKDWTVEIKTRTNGLNKGKCYKCFVNPLNKKFYSKPGVLRYLKKINKFSNSSHEEGTSPVLQSARNSQDETSLKSISTESLINMKSSGLKRIGTRRLDANVLVEKYISDDLPPGWILEIKVEGNRRDPFYTDPVSGHTFQSKKEVLHYLESGEVGRHAFQAKGTVISDLEEPLAAKRKKLTHRKTNDNLQPQQLPTSRDEGYTQARSGTGTSNILTSSSINLPVGKRLQSTPLEKSAGIQEDTLLGFSSTPKSNESQGTQIRNGFAENGSDLLSPTGQEKTLQVNGTEKFTLKKPRDSTRYSKIKNEQNLPRRFSLRLAGLGAASMPSVELGGQAPEATVRSKSGIVPNLGLDFDSVGDGTPRTSIRKVPHASEKAGCLMYEDVEPASEKALQDQVATNKQIWSNKHEKKDNTTEPQNFPPLQNIGRPRKKGSSIAENTRRNFRNREVQSFPRRSSKRLSGLGPAPVTHMELDQQSPQLAGTWSGRGSVISEHGLAFASVDEGEFKQLSTTTGVIHALPNVVGTMDGDPLITVPKPLEEQNVTKDQLWIKEPEIKDDQSEPQVLFASQSTPSTLGKNILEDQSAVEDRMRVQESETKGLANPEPQPSFPSWESWSDPCLEFAFKTLTGAIPIEDEVEIQAYFQQQPSTSHNPKEVGLDLPDVDFPSFLNSEIPSQFDSPAPSTNQLPPQLPPAPGNVNFTGCSSIDHHQPCVEGRANNSTKCSEKRAWDGALAK